MNLRIYITHKENIASFNVLHKLFFRIYQLFLYLILAYEMCFETKDVVCSTPNQL
jgi:hypothetical protein